MLAKCRAVQNPTRRQKVAKLLGDYVELEYTDTVYDPPLAIGQRYMTEEIALGSMNELADQLITLAPRCSFIGWQDPFEGELGEFIVYCPCGAGSTATAPAAAISHSATTRSPRSPTRPRTAPTMTATPCSGCTPAT